MSIADKLTQIAENEQKVYDAGYEAGRADADDSEDAYNQGVEDGKKAEYDAFWDSYQLNGTRKSYQFAFAGAAGDAVGGWTDITFQPKYDIVIDGYGLYDCDMMFQYSKLVDLKGILERNGVVLDFSNAQRLHSTFDRSSIISFPEIDLSSCTQMQMTFQNCRMKDLTLLNIQDTCEFIRPFNGCSYLKNFTLTGTIGQNGFDVGSCTKLSKASIESIINALSDTATGKTLALSKTAVGNAFKKEYSVTLSQNPDKDGYYKVTLPTLRTVDGLLRFSALMDVRRYIGDTRINEWGEEEILWFDSPDETAEGVEYWSLSDTFYDYNYYYFTIKRTDGAAVSEEDVVLIDEGDLGEWDTLIATKPNWNIVLA